MINLYFHVKQGLPQLFGNMNTLQTDQGNLAKMKWKFTAESREDAFREFENYFSNVVASGSAWFLEAFWESEYADGTLHYMVEYKQSVGLGFNVV